MGREGAQRLVSEEPQGYAVRKQTLIPASTRCPCKQTLQGERGMSELMLASSGNGQPGVHQSVCLPAGWPRGTGASQETKENVTHVQHGLIPPSASRCILLLLNMCNKKDNSYTSPLRSREPPPQTPASTMPGCRLATAPAPPPRKGSVFEEVRRRCRYRRRHPDQR